MAEFGHTAEKRWPEVSDVVGRKLRRLTSHLAETEELYQEMLEMWNFHSNIDQDVADQLFTDVNGGSPADTTQLGMTTDAKDALLAAHTIYTTADWSALRRMT